MPVRLAISIEKLPYLPKHCIFFHIIFFISTWSFISSCFSIILIVLNIFLSISKSRWFWRIEDKFKHFYLIKSSCIWWCFKKKGQNWCIPLTLLHNISIFLLCKFREFIFFTNTEIKLHVQAFLENLNSPCPHFSDTTKQQKWNNFYFSGPNSLYQTCPMLH